jgi:hypothetical protein
MAGDRGRPLCDDVAIRDAMKVVARTTPKKMTVEHPVTAMPVEDGPGHLLDDVDGPGDHQTEHGEGSDCRAMVSLAQALMGMTSVGLNAVLVVIPRIK